MPCPCSQDHSTTTKVPPGNKETAGSPASSLIPDRGPLYKMPSTVVEEVDFAGDPVYRPTTHAMPMLPRSLDDDKGATYDRMYDLYRESHGTSDYFRNLKVFFKNMGSPWIWFTIYFVGAIGPFMMLTVGAVNLGNCTVAPMIPVYLIIAGAVWLIKLSMRIYETLLGACGTQNVDEAAHRLAASIAWRAVDSLMGMFLFCWLIAGAVWVYSTFRPFDHVDPAHPLFCRHYVYSVAFWSVTLQLAGIGILFIATTLLMSALMVRQGRQLVAQDEESHSMSVN